MEGNNDRCSGCFRRKKQHPICEFCGYDERRQNDPQQLPAGTVLKGQYQIGRVLGQGGFGITYLGWDLFLERVVAIKEYFPGRIVVRDSTVTTAVSSYKSEAASEYEHSKQRFLTEGRSLARFTGLPNIVEIYNVFEDNNTVYLIMEYVPGMTLRDRILKEGTLSFQETLAILEPVMRDLDRVHKANTIHRDISPDNIILKEGGGAKLLDFGAVRNVENPDQEAMLSKSTVAILKQGYAPLEQYNARGSLGPWTDVYALCATICVCIGGEIPEYAPERASSDHPDEFIDSLPGVSPAQKEVLRKGMALRPRDRIASVSELLTLLHEAGNNRSVPVKPATGTKPAASRTHRKIASADLVIKNFDPEGSSGTVLGSYISKNSVSFITFRRTLEGAPANALDVSETGNGKVLMWEKPMGSGVELFIAGDGRICAPTDCSFFFGSAGKGTPGFEKLLEIDFNDAFDTSSVKIMHRMFSGSKSLQYLNLSSFHTDRVTDMSGMFLGCQSLQYLDLSSFDTSLVTDMSRMFSGCIGLQNLDLGSFRTAAVSEMKMMFSGCKALKSLDLKHFDTGNVKHMDFMFCECSALEYLDLSSFTVSSNPSVLGMLTSFNPCLDLNISQELEMALDQSPI